MIEYIRNLRNHINELLGRIQKPYESRSSREFFMMFVGLGTVAIGYAFNIGPLVLMGAALYSLTFFRKWFLYLSVSLIFLTATLVVPSYVLMAACLIGSIINGHTALREYRKRFIHE